MFTDAQLTEDGWLVLLESNATGAKVNELELLLSDYKTIEDALNSNGYKLAGEWEEGYGGDKFADICAV